MGFDEAYTHVLLQTQTEEQIVFGLHPEITLGLIGTMGLLRTWFSSTLENFLSPSSTHQRSRHVREKSLAQSYVMVERSVYLS